MGENSLLLGRAPYQVISLEIIYIQVTLSIYLCIIYLVTYILCVYLDIDITTIFKKKQEGMNLGKGKMA